MRNDPCLCCTHEGRLSGLTPGCHVARTRRQCLCSSYACFPTCDRQAFSSLNGGRGIFTRPKILVRFMHTSDRQGFSSTKSGGGILTRPEALVRVMHTSDRQGFSLSKGGRGILTRPNVLVRVMQTKVRQALASLHKALTRKKWKSPVAPSQPGFELTPAAFTGLMCRASDQVNSRHPLTDS